MRWCSCPCRSSVEGSEPEPHPGDKGAIRTSAALARLAPASRDGDYPNDRPAKSRPARACKDALHRSRMTGVVSGTLLRAFRRDFFPLLHPVVHHLAATHRRLHPPIIPACMCSDMCCIIAGIIFDMRSESCGIFPDRGSRSARSHPGAGPDDWNGCRQGAVRDDGQVPEHEGKTPGAAGGDGQDDGPPESRGPTAGRLAGIVWEYYADLPFIRRIDPPQELP